MIEIQCELCDLRWTAPRDPALEVPCPDCGADVGRSCKRPSGHRAPFGAVHAARDVAAYRAGKYGTHRADGRCTVSEPEALRRMRARSRRAT